MSTDDVDLGETTPEPTSDLELGEQTRETLLNAINQQVRLAPNATTLLRLAEAYAWVVAPNQDHGSSATS
jgi:hypothetical protein